MQYIGIPKLILDFVHSKDHYFERRNKYPIWFQMILLKDTLYIEMTF